MSWFKQSRVKDPAYLKYMGELPCLVSGTTNATVGHHCLRGGYRGMGMKNDDSMVIPLSASIHLQLHQSGNEVKYMDGWGITNYVEIARKLYELYLDKDYDAMRNLILTREI